VERSSGSESRCSNPFRLAPQQWTVTQYDALSRVTAVVAPGGATTTTAYSGNATTVTDSAQKRRGSLADALGRLTLVAEDPGGLNHQTSYSYDSLDNLRTVTQGGQTRTFVYDSLSRLVSAANPESGTLSYQYDPSGNLLQKVDARAVTTTFAYDDLNRVLSKNYSDGTPAVSYCYDGTGTGCPSLVANAKGRLTQVSSSVSSTSYDGYDAMGRVTRTTQTLGESGYTFDYVYNLAGGLKEQTYPSGRKVSSTFDAAMRMTGLTGTKGGEPGKTYASSYQYAPHGGVEAVKLGNELWESAHYNERLQSDVMGLGTGNGNTSLFKLDYSYGVPANNNGNMAAQVITVGATSLTQSYGYDPLNRLLTAAEVGNWSQTYEYDPYGNRCVTPASYMQASALTPQALSHFNASNNRLVGSGYDLAGNLTTDATSRTFAYDAENRQTSVTTPGQGTVTYSYDGEGRRVKKTQGGQDTFYVYNVLGQLAAEFSAQGPQGPGGTLYLTADHLGSTRVVTDQSRVVRARHDYLPFGEEIPASVGRSAIAGYGGIDGLRQRFTAKERDIESNLDYFGARYFSGAQGRFTSVDPENRGAIANDPQTWNGYSYARNNPLLYTDPTGEAIQICDNNNENCVNSEFDPHYFERTNPNLRFSNGVINAVNEDGSLTRVGTYTEFGDAVEPLVDLTQLGRLYVSVGKAVARGLATAGIRLGVTHGANLVSSSSLPKIHWGRQEKHFPGHNGYIPGRSKLTANPEELVKKAGTGTAVNAVPRGTPGFKERVDFGQVIGEYVDPQSGVSTPTTKGIITYATDGVHIVPARP